MKIPLPVVVEVLVFFTLFAGMWLREGVRGQTARQHERRLRIALEDLLAPMGEESTQHEVFRWPMFKAHRALRETGGDCIAKCAGLGSDGKDCRGIVTGVLGSPPVPFCAEHHKFFTGLERAVNDSA